MLWFLNLNTKACLDTSARSGRFLRQITTNTCSWRAYRPRKELKRSPLSHLVDDAIHPPLLLKSIGCLSVYRATTSPLYLLLPTLYSSFTKIEIVTIHGWRRFPVFKTTRQNRTLYTYKDAARYMVLACCLSCFSFDER